MEFYSSLSNIVVYYSMWTNVQLLYSKKMENTELRKNIIRKGI